MDSSRGGDADVTDWEKGAGADPQKCSAGGTEEPPGSCPSPRATLRPSRPPSCTGGCHPAKPKGDHHHLPNFCSRGDEVPLAGALWVGADKHESWAGQDPG